MTPREFTRETRAWKDRSEAEREHELFLAWKTADFVGAASVGKLPEFKTVLMRSRGAQTFDEMKAQLLTLSKLTGFPLREIKH